MNRHEALQCMTQYGAFAAFCDDRRGELVPGFAGDVVVLDHDLETCHPDRIPQTTVMATVVGGEVVYQATGDVRVNPPLEPASRPVETR